MPQLRRQLQIIADRQQAVASAAHQRLDTLSDDQLRWTPDPKQWSTVDVVDHLIRVHAATSPVLMRSLLAAPPAGEEADKELHYSFTDRTVVNMLSPGARFKLPVPKLYTPVSHHGALGHLIQHLHDEFEAFRVILEYANEKQLKGIKISPPAGGPFHPSILAYMDATVQHNRYHWLQIEALLRDPKFPK
jgi:hypothetical protein